MAAITISSANVAGWQGNASGVQLRIYNNGSFTASSGNIYPATLTCNPASLGTFFQSYACAVSGTVLEIPSITLDSTTDSLDNPSASYSAILFDTSSGKQIQQFGTFPWFVLPPTPTSTSWANIFASGANY